MQPVIILFAKAPISGHVKTRLQPPLTAEQATSLHIAFVSDMLARLSRSSEFKLELHVDSCTDVWSGFEVTTREQTAGDLGLKMVHALTVALSAGAPRAMIVGTDAPTLPTEYLLDLLVSEADVSIGPTEDGGYYAISARRVHPGMFEGVAWSSTNALDQTLGACHRYGLTTALGRTWFDVDKPIDLERLLRCSELPPHTAAWKQRYSGRIWQNSQRAARLLR